MTRRAFARGIRDLKLRERLQILGANTLEDAIAYSIETENYISNQVSDRELYCDYCKNTGHRERNCFKREQGSNAVGNLISALRTMNMRPNGNQHPAAKFNFGMWDRNSNWNQNFNRIGANNFNRNWNNGRRNGNGFNLNRNFNPNFSPNFNQNSNRIWNGDGSGRNEYQNVNWANNRNNRNNFQRNENNNSEPNRQNTPRNDSQNTSNARRENGRNNFASFPIGKDIPRQNGNSNTSSETTGSQTEN